MYDHSTRGGSSRLGSGKLCINILQGADLIDSMVGGGAC